jgi:hypothetical protein
MKSLLIKANGEVRDFTPANGRNFELREMQQAVNGYIELVPIVNHVAIMLDRERLEFSPSTHILVVNEEGLLEELEINQTASLLANQLIVGDVIIAINNLIE